MFSFETLEVYKKALDLTTEVYALTDRWTKDYLYNLTDQVRRASLSVVLNIAEGTSRTKKDFRHFLDLSRGSCFECHTCLVIAGRRNLVTQLELNYFSEHLTVISKMLSGLKKSLK